MRPRATRVARTPIAIALTAALCLGSGALTTTAFAASPTAAAASAPKGVPTGVPKVQRVTLVTGDVVQISTRPDGRRSVTMLQGPDGTVPDATITQAGEHLYVIPRTAIPLLSAKRIDNDLFDVSGLIAQGYDDAHRATLPVIVDYGAGVAAATRAATAEVEGAKRTRTLKLLGDAVYAASKKHAHGFWASITARRDRTGAPRALADGAVRIDLDGKVRALDVSQPLQQIHAPEAWAAGYDGTGVKVAVLDTGYDATHPDLAGKVLSSANFTADPSVVDIHGHGTHVASTIAGSGTASGGTYKGVSPGAELLIGKVLGGEAGEGTDSEVLAGMQWAVAQHADVVSMSLGDTMPGDGTGPLERAVDELSASSPSLFVIAAGNSGPGESTVSPPGAADAALTVGAVDSTDAMAYFSSRGPRFGDGALKPDVVAPGVDIVAARAAGTSMGTPVDDNYTSASGTSMATPHVAGVAAILKQEHPGWDGETLKAAIAASTVPVPGAAAYDAGSGRVDAQRAVEQTVVSTTSVNLGFYAWPHADLEPRSTAITYTNLGSSAVSLTLSVASEDGTGPVPGVSIASDHLTVPAGGAASVDATVDPTVAEPGSYSGAVTATVEGTAQTVRTAVGYQLEPERYDLTVNVEPRPGTQAASHVVSIVGLTDYSFDDRTLDAAAGSRSITFRVPPQKYSVGVTSFGTAADDASESVLDFRPSVKVAANTSVTIDEASARPLTAKVDRPVVNDGTVLMASWTGPQGQGTGLNIFSSSDRLFARPMVKPAGGTVATDVKFQLSQPEGELTLGDGRVLPMRPVPAPSTKLWVTPVPHLSGSLRVVDAGTADAPRTKGIRGALALVSGTCGDLTATAHVLAAAGAAGMVAYAGHGQTCAGTVTGTPPLPMLAMRPTVAAQALAAAGHRATVVTHRTPGYVYDLVGYWPDRLPSHGVVDGTAGSIATVVEHFRTPGGTSADGIGMVEQLSGYLPGRDLAIFGLARRVPLPSTVTHYVTAAAEWDREALPVDDALGGAYADFYATPRTFAVGSVTHDTWFGGPIAAFTDPGLAAKYGYTIEPNRQGDSLYLNAPSLTDAAGHSGAILYYPEFNAKLYQAGELVLDAYDPLMLWGIQAPAERTRYRLIVDDARANLFWQHSTRITTAWRFSTESPAGDHAVLPLMNVRWSVPLSRTGTAPAGADLNVGLQFWMPSEVAAVPLRTDPKVEVSWDGGKTWRRTTVTGCQTAAADAAGGHPTACSAVVHNHRSGAASVRITAIDTAGRTVRQTVIDAWSVR